MLYISTAYPTLPTRLPLFEAPQLGERMSLCPCQSSLTLLRVGHSSYVFVTLLVGFPC